MPFDENAAEPFKLMVTYDPILDNIHDSISGTITTYKEEYLRDPLTNQPITNSAGKPITFLKQTPIPKDGVEPLMGKDGIEFVMGALQSVVNRAVAFANLGMSDIVYTCNDTITLLNDNITLNSQYYKIRSLSAWKSITKQIRNFLFNFLSAVKYGGLRDWAAGVVGVGYELPISAAQPQSRQGVLQRLFSRKQMVDTDSQYGGGK